MGQCCPSSESQSNEPVNVGNSNSSARARKLEERIEIAFKAKRANVYTTNPIAAAIDEPSVSFVEKNITKNAEQNKIILNALSASYMFTSLSGSDLAMIASRMDIIAVSKGENIITQGDDGEYFYIIGSGEFTVIVDDKPVSQLAKGTSFGELALLYNAPRQATVMADSTATVFSLDRENYRYIIAQSSTNRNEEIKNALKGVPLLSNLTDDQFETLSDAVEVFPYNGGDVIIKKGAEGKVFYMVKEGVVKVTDMGDEFSEHSLNAGEYFGERALITGEPRAATITAQSSKVLLMALDRDSFNLLLGPLHDVLDHNMNLRVLTSVKLFSKLTEMEKRKMAQSFELIRYGKDEMIIKQGEQGRQFFILKDGTAKVVADGNEVGQLRVGSYFGEMALLDDELRKASVITTTECECFVLDRDVFVRILSSMQDIMSKETMTRLEVLQGKGDNIADDIEDSDIRFEDLTQMAMLGSGTFGRVSLVQDKATKHVYALKVMHKSEIVAHKQQANTINEKKVMKMCKHPFILRLYQTYKDATKLYMLLEFIQGGELFSVLHTAKRDGVPEDHAKFYASCIVCGLAYMHSKDIAYRDMKPENCLIDTKGYPKLVDFGFAKVITGKSFTLCGTPEYLAPELVLAKGHNRSVDYWALGILIYEMLVGCSPFSDPQGMDQVVICKNIVNGRLTFPRNVNVNNDCKDLIKGLLSREVQTRLGNLKGGLDDIKNHKWFSTISYKSLLAKELEAPWLPKINSITDTSNFEPYEIDPEPSSSNYVDHGNWDREF